MSLVSNHNQMFKFVRTKIRLQRSWMKKWSQTAALKKVLDSVSAFFFCRFCHLLEPLLECFFCWLICLLFLLFFRWFTTQHRGERFYHSGLYIEVLYLVGVTLDIHLLSFSNLFAVSEKGMVFVKLPQTIWIVW